MTGPSTGPSSAGTATTLMTRPMRCGPAARASIVCPTGRMIPPPIPWTTRKAMRLPADQAAPLSTEPVRNSAERGEPQRPRPEALDRPAGERDDQRERQQVAGGDPLDRRDRHAEVAAEVVESDRDDRRVEDRHHAAEQDDGREALERGIDAVRCIAHAVHRITGPIRCTAKLSDMPNRAPSELVWDPPAPGSGEAPPARGRGLTREAIVAAAIAVADADGLDAVSIRRVAGDLGTRPMSLYTHIASKEDLLDLMVNEVVGEALLPEPLPEDWRAAVRAISLRSYDAFVDHAWVLQAFSQRPRFGPNSLRHAEQSLAAVAGLGLDERTAATLLAVVDEYAIGHAMRALITPTRRSCAACSPRRCATPGSRASSPISQPPVWLRRARTRSNSGSTP